MGGRGGLGEDVAGCGEGRWGVGGGLTILPE